MENNSPSVSPPWAATLLSRDHPPCTARQEAEHLFSSLWRNSAELYDSANAKATESSLRPLILVVGSSVALGVGAPTLAEGWSGQLESALHLRGVDLRNASRCGTSTASTLERLKNLGPGGDSALRTNPALVICSLSLNNEGLRHVRAGDEERAREVCEAFLDGLRAIEAEARASFGARLVVGSIYPFDDADASLLEELFRLHSAMKVAATSEPPEPRTSLAGQIESSA
jgi:hypothetical protein